MRPVGSDCYMAVASNSKVPLWPLGFNDRFEPP